MDIGLYPDLEERGSLAALLHAEWKGITLEVVIRGFEESSNGSRYWASVKTSSRSSDITIGVSERVFLAPLWENGVQLVSLSTASTTVLIKALDSWFCKKWNTNRLEQVVPEVEVSEGAQFYEAGAAAYVTHQWHVLRGYISGEVPQLMPVFKIAEATTELRQLLPFTSHDSLSFSRCTGYPFTYDCPTIFPEHQGSFGVQSAAGNHLGQGSAEFAVALTVENLPPRCGPAVHGIANDQKAEPL